MIQPTLINLHPSEYSQEFHHYPFTVKWDRCVGSCNTLNDPFSIKYVFQIKQDLNLSMFNMITRINESLTKHISCECKCKLGGANCNSNQWWNNDKCWCECKKNSYIWKRLCLESCNM